MINTGQQKNKAKALRIVAMLIGMSALIIAAEEIINLRNFHFQWQFGGFIVGLLFLAFRSIKYAVTSSPFL